LPSELVATVSTPISIVRIGPALSPIRIIAAIAHAAAIEPAVETSEAAVETSTKAAVETAAAVKAATTAVRKGCRDGQ
jgi:hypothetical protein